MNEVDHILSNQIRKHKTPAVHYSIFDQNNLIHEFMDGMADVRKGTKIRADSTYHGFSVTKTFTALAILQLEEKGDLSIDDSARRHLPHFPCSGSITIRQLLSHSSGIPNPIPLSWIHLMNESSAFNEADFFKPIFKKHDKTRFKPNERFIYSNLNYFLLGRIVEKISGSTYQKYIRDNILNVLGINPGELGFTLDPDRQVKGYQKRFSFTSLILGFFMDKSRFMGKTEGKWKPFVNYYVNGSAYGGLIGTQRSFVKYVQGLLASDNKLISTNSKKKLFTENMLNSNKSSGMCLSWFMGHLLGNAYFAHAGGGGGYYCEIRIYPEIELGSVIMFNRSGMKDERFFG